MTVQLTIILAPLHYRVSIPSIDVLHYIFSKFYGLEYLEMVFCYPNCLDLLYEKKCSSDQEKLLKFEAEVRKFAKFLSH